MLIIFAGITKTQALKEAIDNPNPDNVMREGLVGAIFSGIDLQERKYTLGHQITLFALIVAILIGSNYLSNWPRGLTRRQSKCGSRKTSRVSWTKSNVGETKRRVICLLSTLLPIARGRRLVARRHSIRVLTLIIPPPLHCRWLFHLRPASGNARTQSPKGGGFSQTHGLK